MIALSQSAEIARSVASGKFGAEAVEDARAEQASGSDGRDAVRITVVLKPDVAERLRDDTVLEALVEIHERLDSAGEERLALVEYATRSELEAIGDP